MVVSIRAKVRFCLKRSCTKIGPVWAQTLSQTCFGAGKGEGGRAVIGEISSTRHCTATSHAGAGADAPAEIIGLEWLPNRVSTLPLDRYLPLRTESCLSPESVNSPEIVSETIRCTVQSLP